MMQDEIMSDNIIEKVKLSLLAMQRHSWEQGVAMQAFFELKDMETVILLAKEAAYRSMADGRVAVIGANDAVTDPCCAGEALLWAARYTGDISLSHASDKLLHWALCDAPRSKDGIVYHLTTRKEFWVDSMYMLPPYLSAAGHFQASLDQIDGYYKALYDEAGGLMAHIWDDGERRFVRSAHWGVGNGWAIAGMARVIALLPDSMQAERSALIEKAAKLIRALLTHMRPDGLFHDVVDDKTTFVETNLSQMLCYTILRGIRDKWLNEEEFSSVCRMLRDAVMKKVDRFGLVQGVCGAPTFDKPGVAPEGQAFFLLMEAEWLRSRSVAYGSIALTSPVAEKQSSGASRHRPEGERSELEALKRSDNAEHRQSEAQDGAQVQKDARGPCRW